ncbi:MAG: carbohydrate kinase family protein [Bacteroidota bacterium]
METNRTQNDGEYGSSPEMSQTGKSDVVVLGELNVDLIANNIEGPPEMGKEVIARSFTTTLGSSSAIFASNLSTLGTSVTFVGRVGNDGNGDFILAELQSKGVDVSNTIRTGNRDTGVTVVLSYGEDRAMITYPGCMTYLCDDDVTDDVLKSSRHLHISSIFLLPRLKKNLVRLLTRAKRLGLTTSLDPQWDPAERWDLDLDQVLPLTDIFLPNRRELEFLTGTSGIMNALTRIGDGNVIVVKDGKEGAILWDHGTTFMQRSFLNEHVVDTIGAGDSFNAGFIHKYLVGEPLNECLKFACLIGAINTTAPGGTAAFRDMNAVRRTAQDLFGISI